MMWSPYVVSSASTRISDGRGRLIAAVEMLEGDVGELVREAVPELRVEPAPELERAADDVLPEAALRLVQRRRAARRERRAVQGRVAAVLVEAVADLVHRREQRVAVQIILGVAGGEPDVLGRERDAERVDRRIEPERLLGRAERARDDEREVVLRFDRIGARDERLRLLGRALCYELAEGRPEAVEDAAHLARLHSLLEVVEQRVVRVVGGREAGDVAVLLLERAVEPRPEGVEVVVSAGHRPCLDALGGELRHLGAEVGRDPAGLFPIALRHGDEAGVVGVGVEARDVWGRPL